VLWNPTKDVMTGTLLRAMAALPSVPWKQAGIALAFPTPVWLSAGMASSPAMNNATMAI